MTIKIKIINPQFCTAEARIELDVFGYTDYQIVANIRKILMEHSIIPDSVVIEK